MALRVTLGERLREGEVEVVEELDAEREKEAVAEEVWLALLSGVKEKVGVAVEVAVAVALAVTVFTLVALVVLVPDTVLLADMEEVLELLGVAVVVGVEVALPEGLAVPLWHMLCEGLTEKEGEVVAEALGQGQREGLTVAEMVAVRHSEGEGDRVTEGQRLTLSEWESVGEVVEETERERVALPGEGEVEGLTLGEGVVEEEGHSVAVLASETLVVLVREARRLKERLGLLVELTRSPRASRTASCTWRRWMCAREGRAQRRRGRRRRGGGDAVPAQVLLMMELLERLCVVERERVGLPEREGLAVLDLLAVVVAEAVALAGEGGVLK